MMTEQQLSDKRARKLAHRKPIAMLHRRARWAWTARRKAGK